MTRYLPALRLLALCLAVAGQAGCRILPEPAPEPALHDLGPLEPGALRALLERIPPGVSVQGIEAPAWLDSTDIHYRFLHQDPTWLRSYARNRWIAPAPALLVQRLRDLLASVPPRTSPEAEKQPVRALSLQLLRFEQRFFSTGRAEVMMDLYATLSPAPPGPTAGRIFSLRRACSPDVQGAVSGLASLTDQAIRELLEWLAGS